jgi:hypothetical protein
VTALRRSAIAASSHTELSSWVFPTVGASHRADDKDTEFTIILDGHIKLQMQNAAEKKYFISILLLLLEIISFKFVHLKSFL